MARNGVVVKMLVGMGKWGRRGEKQRSVPGRSLQSNECEKRSRGHRRIARRQITTCWRPRFLRCVRHTAFGGKEQLDLNHMVRISVAPIESVCWVAVAKLAGASAGRAV